MPSQPFGSTLLGLAFLLFSCEAWGADSILAGRVIDISGSAVSDARLQITNRGTGESRQAASGEDGAFQVTIPEGWYSVRITKAGFANWEEPRVAATGGKSVDVLATLVPGTVRQEVTVLAQSDLFTATRLDVPVRDTPVTGAAVSESLMEQQGALTLRDVIRNVSGANARVDYGVYESYSFRGFAGDRENVLLVDGIRSEGNRVNTQLSHIERVEILKGPASVLYGNDAFSGAVNLIRKRPQADRHHEFEMSYGRWNDLRISGGTTGQLRPNLLYRLDAGGNVAEGWRDIHPRRFNATPSLYWYPSARNQITLHYTFIRDSFRPDGGIPLINGAIPDVSLSRRFNTPNDFALSRDHNLQVGYTLALSPTSQLRNTLSIRRFADEYFGAESYGFEAPDTVTRAGLYFLHDRDPLLNQSQLHVTARLPQIHRILIGYEYQRFPSDTDRSNFLTVTPISLSRPVETEPARDRFPTARWIRFRQNIHAIYAQDHIELTPKLKLLAGVRADIFRRWNRTDPVSSAGAVATGAVNTRDLEAVTGRAGLVYNLAPSYSVYGSWSSAFRPNFQVPFDNRVLEPEQGRQFEVGQRLQSPDGRLAVNVAVYQLNKSNVTFARVGNIFDQAGRVRSRGIEIDVDARVDSRTTIAANYSFNNIRFQDFFAGSVNLTGFRPRYAPRHTGNLWATRSFGAMTFALGGQYVGRMFSDNTNLVPIGEYFLADAAVTWRREVWEVGLNVANLFNKERYFPTSIYDTQLYPGSPVSAMISVRWRK